MYASDLGISLSTPGATAWGTLPATWGSTAPQKPIMPVIKPVVIKPTITSKPITLPMPVLKVPAPTVPPVTPTLAPGPVSKFDPSIAPTGSIPSKPVTSLTPTLSTGAPVIVGTLPKAGETNNGKTGLFAALGDIDPNALMFIGLAALVMFMESGQKTRRKGR